MPANWQRTQSSFLFQYKIRTQILEHLGKQTRSGHRPLVFFHPVVSFDSINAATRTARLQDGTIHFTQQRSQCGGELLKIRSDILACCRLKKSLGCVLSALNHSNTRPRSPQANHHLRAYSGKIKMILQNLEMCLLNELRHACSDRN